MRALTIVVLALVLAMVRGQSQSAAREIETRWKNCSEVVKGRLGALHSETSDDLLIDRNNGTFLSVNYSPCIRVLSYQTFLVVSHYDTTCYYPQAVNLAGQTVQDNTISPIVDFIMATKQGEVARFHASYSGGYNLPGANSLPCPPEVLMKIECTGNATSAYVEGAVLEKTSGLLTPLWDVADKKMPNVITVRSTEACPRFPYSNKGVPPGGVGAIIVVVICFILQFGVCAWYHKTHAAIATNMDDVDAAYTQHE